MPTIERITIYPIKALDGQAISPATLLPSGALAFDRRWALLDAEGKYINGKRTARVHALRSHLDLERQRLTLERSGEVAEFDMREDRAEAEHWLSEHFDLAVRVVEQPTAGFPDDTDAPGPTVISTATLETVAAWFPGLTLDDARRRFRANLEIGGVEPFWEDRLYAEAGEGAAFRIGDVTLLGVNPCQRCVVPTRSPESGAIWPAFAKQFGARRAAELPAWATRSRFNHFYRLAINTSPLAGFAGGQIACGDAVELA
ncbi:MAG TPA: MOSC N-terminal beta barrel domain-containing protein [Pirellulaceae bacterium]|nr:MOSC N-terminal beta barrel domain-containing protein [Pirellulaceae bacterium]